MDEQKFEKLLFLLKDMLPEDKRHLIDEIGDENISIEKFKFNCRLAHMSPEERKIFMVKNTGNYGVAVERINPDGQIFYKLGGRIHEKESLKDWVDITGRVTDGVVLNGNSPKLGRIL